MKDVYRLQCFLRPSVCRTFCYRHTQIHSIRVLWIFDWLMMDFAASEPAVFKIFLWSVGNKTCQVEKIGEVFKEFLCRPHFQSIKFFWRKQKYWKKSFFGVRTMFNLHPSLNHQIQYKDKSAKSLFSMNLIFHFTQSGGVINGKFGPDEKFCPICTNRAKVFHIIF